MDTDEIINRSLSKALRKEIKYFSVCTRKIEQPESIQPAKELREKVIVCLSESSFIFMDEQLGKKILEDYSYQDLDTIVIDKKYEDVFYIFIKTNDFLIEKKKLTIYCHFRDKLIKNFMCYYSIFYMLKYAMIRDLSVRELANQSKKQIQKEQILKKNLLNENVGRYKILSYKHFNYYVKHQIISNFDSKHLQIKYVKDDGEDGENIEYFSNECEIHLEVGEDLLMGKVGKDEQDLGYYANSFFTTYMRNVVNTSSFWVLKNTIYQKKLNLNEDKCPWDGWIIECRCSFPSMKNYVFIFYRRKFLPPHYDRFKNINIILEEKCSESSPKINPKAYDVIFTIANTIHCEKVEYGIKEFKDLLEAKYDGLFFDSESIHYFQNILNIFGKESLKFGFSIVQNILLFLEDNIKEGEKIFMIRSYLESKKKQIFLNDNEVMSSDLHKKKIFEIFEKFLNIIDEPDKETISPSPDEKEQESTTGNTTNGKTGLQNTNTNTERQTHTVKKKKKIDMKKRAIWKNKVTRFLTFCINGGLTDYGFTIESFIEYIKKCQSGCQEYTDFIMELMNIVELNSDNHNDEDSKINISGLTENSDLDFNEEAVAICIRSGFLSKQLSAENTKHCPNFLKILLTKYISHKLLFSTTEFLRILSKETQGNDGSSEENERNDYRILFDTFIDILSNSRSCPLMNILACKCLCSLVCNENDGRSKAILVQAEIIPTIANYLEDITDEKFLLSLLELLYLVIPETKLIIYQYLYKELDLLNKLKNLFNGPKVPGCYFSIRTYVKIIMIFLNLTNILQADLRNKLITNEYKDLFGCFLRLLEDNDNLFDPKEELSFVLEHKVFFLIQILLAKNIPAQELLISHYHLFDIIQEKSLKYQALFNTILDSLGNKDFGFTQKKIESIMKTISKFLDLTVTLMSGEKVPINIDRITFFSKNNTNFKNLIESIHQSFEKIKDNYIKDIISTPYSKIKKLFKSIMVEDY